MSHLTSAHSANSTTPTPSQVKLTIANGAGYTNTPSVQTSFQGLQDTPSFMAFFEGAGCTGTETWVPYAATTSLSLSGPDGTKTISAKVQTAGMASACLEASIVLDQTAPALTVTSGTHFWNSLNTVSFNGACETGLSVSVSGSDSTTLNCTAGAWTYNPTAVSNAARTYTLTQTDLAGNATSVNLAWNRATPTFADEFNTFQQWSVWDQWGGSPGVTSAVQANGTAAVGYLQACTVSSGVLSITVDHADPTVSGGYSFTDGLIATDTSYSQMYGYFEMRAKIPSGRGLWPAFWLRPVSGTGDAEIDVMEVLGQTPTELLTTVHTDDGGSNHYTTQTTTTLDLSADFHTYGVEWTATTLTWYLDGHMVFTTATPTDSNQPMYLILDLWLGAPGSAPGAPDGSTPYPSAMQVDYVRAFSP